MGTRRSAWPRPMTSSRDATIVPSGWSSAAVQAAVDVSSARINGLASCQTRRHGGTGVVPGQEKSEKSDRFDGLDLRHIMFDQSFDPAFERDRGRGTARTGA